MGTDRCCVVLAVAVAVGVGYWWVMECLEMRRYVRRMESRFPKKEGSDGVEW